MAMPNGLRDLPISINGYYFDYVFTREGLRLTATDGWKVFKIDYDNNVPDVAAFVREAYINIKTQWKRGALTQTPPQNQKEEK